MRLPPSAALATLVAAACLAVPRAAAAQAAPQRGAFVVRLGADTVAVERYERTRTQLRSEQVTRSPATVRRTFTVDLGAGGAPTAMNYDAQRLSGGAPPTHAEFAIGPDTVTARVRAGARDTTLHVAARNGIPFVFLSYALYELQLERARAAGGDSAELALVAVGAAAPTQATVRRVGRDSMTLAIFEPTPSRARVDAAGRLLGVNGMATTEKVIVERVAEVDVDAVAARWAAADSAGGAMGVFSPLDSTSATVGGAELAIVYSRPSLRGRPLMGTLIPYDQIWRTGANAATVFRTSRDIEIGGTALPAGSYTLWTMATPTGAQLVVNSQTGQWGTEHDVARDVATIPLTVTTTTGAPVEQFVMQIEPTTDGATLRYLWGDRAFSVPIRVR